MEFVNLMLHVVAILGIVRLGMMIREIEETIKIVMFEQDIPEIPDDLRRYVDGKDKGW